MRAHRTLTAITTAALLVLPLAACEQTPADPPTTSANPQSDPPSANPADATPQQRIQAYFDAFDAAAATGWKDTSYADEYLVPEVAKQQKKDDKERATTGAIITGQRKLTDWTVTDENDTTATIEFCDNTDGQKATKDGKPATLSDQGDHVAQFKLKRSSTSEPWMITQLGYYKEGTTCAEHFAR